MKVTSELNPGNDGAISHLYQIKIKQYGGNKHDEQNSRSNYTNKFIQDEKESITIYT